MLLTIDRKKLLIHTVSILIFYSFIYIVFFSPVIFSKQLLAPGDGIVQSVPAFYSARTLWTDLLLSGFPVAADPQTQTWYPISILFSFIPNSWNSFVISAYVLASCFCYGYVYTLTSSTLAAFASGIIYGMSGFMMAHLGHTMMIHTAVWMPLLIWTLEKLRHKSSNKWFVIGVFSVACSCLAGHPQIFVYSIGLSVIYALILGWVIPNRWKYYQLCLSIFILGLALSFIQLLPTIELMALSPRAKLSFDDFVSYSLPIHQSIELLFPYLFGTHSTSSFYQYTYFGSGNLTELTGYIGLLPLMLAVIGYLSSRHKLITQFWFYVGLLALLLTLGSATPLAHLMYHVPAYNKFRVPARHFIEMAFSISVLAGLGIANMPNALTKRIHIKVVIASTGLVIFALLGIFIFHKEFISLSSNDKFSLLPWENLTIGIPLVVFIIAATTLVSWNNIVKYKLLGILLPLILIVDLGSFGWFYEWKYAGVNDRLLNVTNFQKNYQIILENTKQRLLPINGAEANKDEIPPNMSRLWKIPSASGYGPFILSRYSELLSMNPAGFVDKSILNKVDRSLDITSTSYILLPSDYGLLEESNTQLAITKNSNISWSERDIDILLGSGCGVARPNSVNLKIPSNLNATAIGIVSSLGCALNVPDNSAVLNISAIDAKGNVASQYLRAGRDTSEWAYDRSDVRPYIKHRKAPLFADCLASVQPAMQCGAQGYVSIIPLADLHNIKSLKLEWIGSSGSIGIKKISLINQPTEQSYPITEIHTSLNSKSRWRKVDVVNKTQVYKNLSAMPRAWLVPEVIRTEPKEILKSIKSSQLSNGSLFDPKQTALIEEDFTFKPHNTDANAKAQIVSLADTSVEILTKSKFPTFLVLSDTNYPGWTAKIDGNNTHIFQTNYTMRGVSVPAGQHTVKFEFKPLTFRVGASISMATMFFVGYIYFTFKSKF